ncbi:polysaccharide biosynthesis/export family protein [Donghicola mangrovi]|uniref:Polysaccharide export protein N-terminal domain-containing protein n=1 Tax=Donghicola mangrovi TaxID=2729614 RepID=A0A850Q7M4_9RHOB|nr:polysaccharide biosynthesis/export family protein [Donghicola mangrovi]NVO22998.1 hypothetical protein [Donghicola mangrovi]
MKVFQLLFFIIIELILGSPSFSSPYTLSKGDVVSLVFDLSSGPRSYKVDLDGNLRIPELGIISAQGLSLNQVSDEIKISMISAGFNGIPTASVEIVSYSPIFISSDIVSSGYYEYFPGMTLGMAIGLSRSEDNRDSEAKYFESNTLFLEREVTDLKYSISDLYFKMIRLNAVLAGVTDDLTISESELSPIFFLSSEEIGERLVAENSIFQHQISSKSSLFSSWEREISDAKKQISLIDQRIKLKGRIIEQLDADVANIAMLKSQGLSTSVRSTEASRRVFEEREELLSLETMKLNVEHSIQLAERNKMNYEIETRDKCLEDLNEAKNRYTHLSSLLQTYTEQQYYLHSQIGNKSEGQEDIIYKIDSRNSGRESISNVDLNTPLFPGDIIFIEFRQ